ncbi:hypothetical protein LTR82_000399 [Friedmanniomyces endolithicus]|uniref:DUF7820 domain-containing protein n=1 Tax=Friedmanniomyces endolithicus TaxID=329885 RepID=A0AAN6G286_9PEZI|nr:hypothetical protein LTR82_000399 [Friedmanniomyces endolithicus]
MERRSLLDGELTPTRESANVFDDEYEVEDDGIADGYRPATDGGERSARGSTEFYNQPMRTRSAHSATRPASPLSPGTVGEGSRNSTRKPRGQENPFASPEDAEETPSLLSFEPDMAHRSVSSASSRNFASTSTPVFGAGPSHPYNMYPQDSLQRTPSLATQSTARAASRRSAAAAGPQHPYAMYPQGVSEDDDDDETVLQDAAPVGFPGLGRSYQRRVGPDGEEQDIVGADGHAEQLPPYTRYPEEGAEKVPLLGVPAPPTALHSRAPVAGTDPTMALMHEPIRPVTPQPQSMMDESNLRGDRPASLTNVESMRTDSAEDSMLSNKSWKEKTWKEKRKTRFCGVPFWWLLLGASVATFITAVLAGVIGGFFAHEKEKARDALAAASTRFYDASAIATPASGPPTGTYKLPLSTPQETQAACLTVPNQQPAWSCNFAGLPAQAISVGIPPNGNQTGAFLFSAADNDDQLYYGAQQPFMQTSWAPFHAVQDNDSPESGPAFYFQQMYDKVVVVPEAALSLPGKPPPPPPGKEKRQGLQIDEKWLLQKQVAQAGEKPWFCVWNNTFIEGFIYVQQPVASTYLFKTTAAIATPTPNATAATETSATGTPATGTSATGTSATGTSATQTTAAPSGSPTSFITTTVTGPTGTTTFTGPAAQYSDWSSQVAQYQTASTGSTNSYNNNNANNGSPSGHSKRHDFDDAILDQLQTYPYVVKIEERRVQGNNVTPYCQQYQVLDNGGYNWVADANGNPITIQLQESDPGYGAYQSAGEAGPTSIKGRSVVAGVCHCQWLSGQAS